jgi:hydrogenase-4 component E
MKIILFVMLGLLATAYGMASSKRLSALIGNFRLQSLFLCAMTFLEAMNGGHTGLYVISAMLLVLKVLLIPYIILKISDEIKVNENLGFVLSPQLSLVLALLFTYLSWVFSGLFFSTPDTSLRIIGSVSFTIMFIGLFIMVFRMKALSQVIGLLTIENGIFLLASAAGGMPFLVEMAVFFDVFVGVIILGTFIYRINRLFVSIDVNRLNRLKG